MAELDNLIKTRTSIKSKLTRSGTFVKSFDLSKDNIHQLKTRKLMVESAFNEYNNVQNEIELIDLNTSVEKHAEERERIENQYCIIIGDIEALLEKVLVINAAPSAGSTLVNNESNKSNAINLPALNLKTFSGSYKEWLSFYNSFVSIIDDKGNNLTNCQRLQYLKSCLKDEALRSIEALEISDENYKVAWDILEKRFKNTRLIVHDHVLAIIKAPRITKPSHTALRDLLNALNSNVAALKKLNVPIDTYHALIVPIVVEKLDYNTVREWQGTLTTEIAQYDSLKTFLERRCQVLESLNSITNNNQNLPEHSNKTNRRVVANVSTHKFSKFGCVFCNKPSHSSYQCIEFLKLPVAERISKIEQLKLCSNCLRKNHQVANCFSKRTCSECNQNHHTLIHVNGQNTNSIPENTENVGVTLLSDNAKFNKIAILPTAVVLVKDVYNNMHNCRALLDSGSMSNYISAAMCKKLDIEQQPIHITIGGIGQIKTNVKHSAVVSIKSKQSDYSSKLKCLVIDKITENLPLVTIDKTCLKIPNNIQLADPNFSLSAPIDLLIGTELFWELLGSNKIINGPSVFQETRLGWVVGGLTNPSYSKISAGNKRQLSMNTVVLERQLEKFWKLEECNNTSNASGLSKEHLECEYHFKQTTIRNADGRFIIKLPFKENPPNLGESRDIALKQFYNLERNLTKKPDLKIEYVNFMREYEQLDHMERVPDNELTNTKATYLPHHAVIKDSISTKLRVVFNASLKTTNGLSLNDNLLSGPTIQQDLFSILTRFRTYKYVLSGDIAKMYRMIQMNPDHTNFHRIFWRENPECRLKTFRLKTLTYGTKPASFIATRCLKELAIQNESRFPVASAIIQRDIYVDDLLTGHDSLEELLIIRNHLMSILNQGGFILRKWASNHPILLPRASTISSNLDVRLDKDEFTKTLGLLWNPTSDSLKYEVKPQIIQKEITKRGILSVTAQIFDPLGLLGPIIIKAKIILQQLWSLKTSWDEPVPRSIYCVWTDLVQELSHLNKLKVPRNVLLLTPKIIELHGFSDASQIAYGAAVYLRVIDQNNQNKTQLLCAKSRVAPLRTITVPRLELSAALLLARLVDALLKTLNLNLNKIFLWTDSTIVLAWINSNSGSFQTFVANRISEIQSLSSVNDWNHVRSEDNPADLLSRGTSPSHISNSNLWWHGPKWLSQNFSEWPINTQNLSPSDLPERRKVVLVCNPICSDELLILTKFSSFVKTQRVMAWVLRFINNCKKSATKHVGRNITVNELNDSTKTLIRLIQKREFASEMSQLIQGKPINKKSPLLTLNPFYDVHDRLIRVGGRLKNSSLTYDVKHPILLPKNHHITKLLITNEHLQQLHTGLQGTLAALRQKFWIISGRSSIRSQIHKCVKCFRSKPTVMSPIMGNLPSSRTEYARPFSVTGVDYAGPVLIKESRGRGKRNVKAYIAVFVCFSTKAVHLELVGDLTSDSFLNALKRLISRRGHVSQLYSDNGTNFRGADRELNELKEFLESNQFVQVISDLANKGITWHHIPPRSPHMGGLWEINVKSVKYHLRRIVGHSHLTYEEMYTLLTRIEAILNSRPITPLSSDPNDLNALTPGHFLIGQPLTAITEVDIKNVSENRLRRWQRVEQIRQHFWQRWRNEYLTQLQQRPRGQSISRLSISIGDLVVVIDDNTPPQAWRLGRIIDLHPGTDGVVRVVTIKTSSGEVKRAVRKVCVLPKLDN